MRPHTLEEIARITGGILEQGAPSRRFTGVKIDSRTVSPGDLFIALCGERADGHDFLMDVVGKGGGGAIVERPGTFPGMEDATDRDFGLIRVENTVLALQALASSYLREVPATVIGVTGSVGKTSTKDFVCSVLSTRFSAYGNPGNLNSHVGLPLAILAMENSPSYVVLEMAMRGRGEIRELCAVARPRIGILTDISSSHAGVLGSLEEIALAKAEILESLPPDGVAIVSGDNEWVRMMSSKARCPTVFYGFSEGCDVRAVNIESLGADGSSFSVDVRDLLPQNSAHAAPSWGFRLRVPGVHQVHNALAAVAVGLLTGIPYESIRKGLENAVMSPMRLDIHRGHGLTVIDDAYNASPKSVKAALDLLASVGEGRRLAILGDMLEMGDYGPAAHREIGRYARGKASHLLCAGDLAREIKAGWDEDATNARATSSWFPDRAHLEAFVGEFVQEGDTCLVKASRGMGFESIALMLRELKRHDSH